jgi:hypothetical protein
MCMCVAISRSVCCLLLAKMNERKILNRTETLSREGEDGGCSLVLMKRTGSSPGSLCTPRRHKGDRARLGRGLRFGVEHMRENMTDMSAGVSALLYNETDIRR